MALSGDHVIVKMDDSGGVLAPVRGRRYPQH